MYFTTRKKRCALLILLTCTILLGSFPVLQAKVDKLSFRYDSGYSWNGAYVYGAYPGETVRKLLDAAAEML